MKIVYVLGPENVRQDSGIKKQAEIWMNSLREEGHEVIGFSQWNIPNWNTVDIIHIFGNGLWLIETVKLLYKLKKPIILSPIFDTFKNVNIYRWASYFSIPQLNLFSVYSTIRQIKDYLSGVLVRSNHEYKYMEKAYGIDKNRIFLLRLPCRITDSRNIVSDLQKRNYCLHVSAFTQWRKNVMNLMRAAAKYKFDLVIAGYPGSSEESRPFYEFASKYNNIKILGRVSEERLLELYDQAKVFALPSFEEGVGFVALEAAVRKCNIVLTEIGGPKEYFNGMAELVDPYNIDEIGKAIIKSLEKPIDNTLSTFIENQYNQKLNTKNLINIYSQIISNYENQEKIILNDSELL